MESVSLALLVTAASIGAIHTVLGPDHYVPFVAMAKARSWSLRRTAVITSLCGVGHVLGSIALGFLGIALGWALGGLEAFESWRGEVAGWLLLGFGLAYTAWGIRRGLRRRPHTHWHDHEDGSVHLHVHEHEGSHAHLHPDQKRVITPWVLFVIFVFGPCEPLIPILMYPAARGSWWGVAAVAGVFAVTTIATMVAVVTLGVLGLSGVRIGSLERWSHALAGAALVACGLAVRFGL